MADSKLSEQSVKTLIRFFTRSPHWNWASFYDSSWEADPDHRDPDLNRCVEETQCTVRIVAPKGSQLFRDFQQAFIHEGRSYSRKRAPYDWLTKVLARIIASGASTDVFEAIVPELASGCEAEADT